MTTLFVVGGNKASLDVAANSIKTVTFENADLAKFKTSETGDYRLHPVTFGSRKDHSFRLPLDDGHYVNGLLLHGDCGGQTITDLGNFVTVRHDPGHAKDTFNYNLALGFKGFKSARMDVTVTFENGYESCRAIFNMTTATTVLSDDFIVDDYSQANLPSQISRDAQSYHEYIYGHDSNGKLNSNSYNIDSGTRSHNEDKADANCITFRINGYMSNNIPENSVSVTINRLTITYSC